MIDFKIQQNFGTVNTVAMKTQHIRAHAKRTPEKPAIIMAGTERQLTYAELSSNANRCAQLLYDRGLRPGDCVALLLENRLEFLEICWAAVNSGLFFTPISTHLKVDEIAYIVNDCEASVVFVSDKTLDLGRAALLECPELTKTINVSVSKQYSHALIGYPDKPLTNERRGAPMVYSSGTTGRPKGILPMEDHASPLQASAMTNLLAQLYGFSEETVYLSPAPLYHTAPLKFNLAVTSLGGTAVICERFEEEAALSNIERYRITHSQWVPTMFNRFLKLPENIRTKYDLSSQCIVIHAAAPCPPAVKRAMIEWWGPIIYEYYAGSESVGLCAISPEEYELHPGSVGRAVKGIVHILNDHGEELPPGETGTIYFSGGPKFSYHKDPEKTRDAYTAKGWATFGDLGYLNESGYLYLSDRRQDLILSGGVNIYPQEAENLLIEHPQVADAAVFGIPNEEFGEEVKACVQLLDKNEAGAHMQAKLLSYCRERLSHIKCPRSIDFLDSLPRQDNGKLYKRELKARYVPLTT